MSNPRNIRSGSTTELINRRVSCRFSGVETLLDLSLGLFSSATVDAGSMLLLKSVAGRIPLESLTSVLDVGCGAGTLGLSVARRCPDARVTMVDRDELAVEFSRHNARVNKLQNTTSFSRLMLEGPHEGPYDLILSNLPAKAGDPVLSDFLRGSAALLAPGGTTAIVIVHTLAERCRAVLMETGMTITHEDSSVQHTVFHFRSGVDCQEPEGKDASGGIPDSGAGRDRLKMLAPYIRYSGEFKFKQTGYSLDTVWNIGDFDTPSWRLQLMGDLLDREARSGVLAFWSPGQGHLPVLICRRKGARPEKVILAGRDRLELLISAHNLEKSNPSYPVVFESLPDSSGLGVINTEKGVDFLLTDINPVPRSAWAAPLRDAAAAAVKPGGSWAVLGRSADIATLTKNTRGWTPLSDRRNRGWRAAIFRKN